MLVRIFGRDGIKFADYVAWNASVSGGRRDSLYYAARLISEILHSFVHWNTLVTAVLESWSLVNTVTLDGERIVHFMERCPRCWPPLFRVVVHVAEPMAEIDRRRLFGHSLVITLVIWLFERFPVLTCRLILQEVLLNTFLVFFEEDPPVRWQWVVKLRAREGGVGLVLDRPVLHVDVGFVAQVLR